MKKYGKQINTVLVNIKKVQRGLAGQIHLWVFRWAAHSQIDPQDSSLDPFLRSAMG